jgi:cytochrome c oxidase assembly protein subunit 11
MIDRQGMRHSGVPAGRNRRVALTLAGVVVGMVGLSFAAVPLYDLFCRVTGFGGTTQVATSGASGEVLDREIVIRFNADTNPMLPWHFQPEQREMRVRVGEQGLGFYRATSRAQAATSGTATYNVTPHKAGIYFSKIECFCFTEQALEPGESMQFPVAFFVDPAIADDRNMDDVRVITLSYTFFPSRQQGDSSRETARLAD